ncbi:MAG: DsbA family protein [Oceanospirillaceae bacterium]|uniref:DsbA family protein n=1 Tax=Marinobacterium litorale TaxID=404770 RepID=UPI0004228CC3|nr:DsbA family protein [Marinobacterium litorale]MBT00526.1 DsbA family protein [Oceanospirillaceae bacterium]
MKPFKLHYIFDPLCGWCYAAEPLLAVAQANSAFELVLHGGWLMRGQRIAPAMRAHIASADRRIEQLTGQPFGEGYLNGLLQDPETVLDSRPPITAILAAGSLGVDPFAMQRSIQHAHYEQGLRVSELDTLAGLATTLGIDSNAFLSAFSQQSKVVMGHIDESLRLLEAAGGGGFPTLLLETGAGMKRLDLAGYYGKPDQWRAFLAASV